MTDKRTSGTLRFFAILVALAAGFSTFQYHQTGRLNWYQTPYVVIRDLLLPQEQDVAGSTAEIGTGAELAGFVTSVTDGDTFILRTGLFDAHTIRLFGIDTPEWDQPHGEAASKALREKLLLESVTVAIRDIDTYDRYVGVVMLDGRNINLEMVAEGHAWWYEYYASGERDLRQAQDTARDNRLGLWANPDPMPPWDWRRRR